MSCQKIQFCFLQLCIDRHLITLRKVPCSRAIAFRKEDEACPVQDVAAVDYITGTRKGLHIGSFTTAAQQKDCRKTQCYSLCSNQWLTRDPRAILSRAGTIQTP